MANNYKIKMKDIQNKYKFKIFCAGYEYDDTELRNAINQRALISEAGRYIELELNPNTYVLTAKLKDKNNNLISTSTPIDLPLESMIVDCDYDATTKSLIITLQNGNTTSIPLGDLIDGLATEEDLNEVREELDKYKTIYNVLPKVNGSGENITLDNTGNATLKMDLKGNTSQSGEPTPDAPIPVNVVSGDNSIEVGNNVFDISAITPNSFIDNNGNIYASSSSNLSDYIEVKENDIILSYDYTTLVSTSTRAYCWFDSNKNFISGNLYSPVNKINKFSVINNAKYIRFTYDKNINNIKVSNKSASYPISLGDIELCKIGTYQDKIFKNTPNTTDYDSNLEDNVWYLKKEIGKLNLSSIPFNAINTASTNTTRVTWYSIARNYQGDIALCDKLPYNINIWNQDTQGFAVSNSTGYVIFRINKSIVGSTEEEINNYLSNNDLIFYSPLATPTYTLIEDTTLINQLDALESAMSYKGQTNISQINNDAPFIIDATALKDLSSL